MDKRDCFGKYSKIDVYCKECSTQLDCCKETDGIEGLLNKICIGAEIIKIDVVEPGEIVSMDIKTQMGTKHRIVWNN